LRQTATATFSLDAIVTSKTAFNADDIRNAANRSAPVFAALPL
jgi:hypothetical protein